MGFAVLGLVGSTPARAGVEEPGVGAPCGKPFGTGVAVLAAACGAVDRGTADGEGASAAGVNPGEKPGKEADAPPGVAGGAATDRMRSCRACPGCRSPFRPGIRLGPGTTACRTP